MVQFSYCLFLILLATYCKSDSPRWDLMYQTDYDIDTHRIEVKWYNKTYMHVETFELVRYNRSYHRVLNASLHLYKQVGTNFTVRIQAYKQYSNAYKYFPLTATLNICQEYLRNSFRMKDFVETKTNMRPCPQKPGYLQAIHLGGDRSRFPPLIPTGDYMLSMISFHQADKLGELEVYGSVRSKNKKIF